MIDPDESFPGDVEEAPPDDATYYVVQRGETLAGVALKLGVKQSELKRANRMYGSKTLVAGQVLKTSAPGSSSGEGTVASSTSDTAAAAAAAMMSNAQQQEEDGKTSPAVQAEAAKNGGVLIDPPATATSSSLMPPIKETKVPLEPGLSSGLLYEPPHWGGGGSGAGAEFGAGTDVAAAAAAFAAVSRSRQSSDASSSASATAAAAGASVRGMFNYIRTRAAAVRAGSFYGDETGSAPASSSFNCSTNSHSSGGYGGDGNGNSGNSGGFSSAPTTPAFRAFDEALPPSGLWGGAREGDDDGAATSQQRIAREASDSSNKSTAQALLSMVKPSYWTTGSEAGGDGAGGSPVRYGGGGDGGGGDSISRRMGIPIRAGSAAMEATRVPAAELMARSVDGAPGAAREREAGAVGAGDGDVPLKLPGLVCGGSTIVTHSTLARMEAAQPKHHRGYNWHLLFSSYRDGASYMTLYDRIKAEDPTFLIVENMKGEVFGGFAASAWASGHQYYGTGECFLFKINGERVPVEHGYGSTSGDGGGGGGGGDGGSDGAGSDGDGDGGVKTLMEGDMTTYGWTGMNMYLQYSDAAGMGMGGGGVEGSFGLFLGEDFLSGSTGTCDTYGNPPLCSEPQFQVSQVEVWGFTTADTEMGARLERLRKTLRGKTTRPL